MATVVKVDGTHSVGVARVSSNCVTLRAAAVGSVGSDAMTELHHTSLDEVVWLFPDLFHPSQVPAKIKSICSTKSSLTYSWIFRPSKSKIYVAGW